MIGIPFTFAISQQNWAGVTILGGVTTFITYLMTSTYYVIDHQQLKIKSGFLVNLTIHIDHIHEIKETKNPLAAPALSLDRLAIYYNKADVVLVSPKDKNGFIKHLSEISPQIAQ
jgi:Bacterial PH domain